VVGLAIDMDNITKNLSALDKMDDELRLLEKLIIDYDNDSISKLECRISELVNFYDQLINTNQVHPGFEANNRLVSNIIIWRNRAANSLR